MVFFVPRGNESSFQADICKLFKNKKTFYKLNLTGNGTKKGVIEMWLIYFDYSVGYMDV